MFAACVGFVNGYMVIRTGLPSFIVTLATFFILRGVNLGGTKAITDTVRVGGLRDVRRLRGRAADPRQTTSGPRTTSASA